jgi:hypothetical protein
MGKYKYCFQNIMNIFVDIIINSEQVNINVKNDITGELIMLVHYDSTLQ